MSTPTLSPAANEQTDAIALSLTLDERPIPASSGQRRLWFLEQMEPDANQREMLYQHDMGIVRLRRHLRKLATAQIEASEEKSE